MLNTPIMAMIMALLLSLSLFTPDASAQVTNYGEWTENTTYHVTDDSGAKAYDGSGDPIMEDRVTKQIIFEYRTISGGGQNLYVMTYTYERDSDGEITAIFAQTGLVSSGVGNTFTSDVWRDDDHSLRTPYFFELSPDGKTMTWSTGDGSYGGGGTASGSTN